MNQHKEKKRKEGKEEKHYYLSRNYPLVLCTYMYIPPPPLLEYIYVYVYVERETDRQVTIELYRR